MRRWKQKYEKLQESKQYPLTEETGQRILLVLTDNENKMAKPRTSTVVAENKAAQHWSQIVKQQTTASSCSGIYIYNFVTIRSIKMHSRRNYRFMKHGVAASKY